MAAVIYLPLLITRPGQVSADTKTYLYLGPGRLINQSRSMWDPTIGLGTVPHQRIGFLWPMGPYYWLTDTAGIPDWLAQRIWWGSIMFLAGAGVAYLLRTLGWRGAGVTAATFAYALSPVVLPLIARLSGVLLPFVALPWMIAFTIRAVRYRGWRYPALFALTVATFGSVNATALVLAGVGPMLWLPYVVWGAREARLRDAGLAALKIGCLTLAVSAWWIAGLNVQRTHGLDILRYTETARTVAAASVSHEVLRGLGYWFFYGRDRLGAWVEPSRHYTQSLPLLAITYLIPFLALTGAAVARWRHRAYFVLLLLTGTALAVGAYPWDANPPFGRLVQSFQGTDAGLAMRSLPRAVPLVALAAAVLIGSGVAALGRSRPRLVRPLVCGVVVLSLLALPPLWLGRLAPRNISRAEEVPVYWQEAAALLDSRDHDTRVLVVPGSDFAAYAWGNTVDPVLPGLTDRPSVQRELVPNGSPPAANLLNAFDLTLQERTAHPNASAPMARLLRAGDMLVINEWEYELNSTPDPVWFWDFVQVAPGFSPPIGLGPQGDPDAPPELAVLPVEDPLPIVTTHPRRHPLLVAGDGAGLVDAAAAGLIDGGELIRYSASLDRDGIDDALDDGAALLLTDSNRKRGERWNTLRHNRGYTETSDDGVLTRDPGDNRLPVFPTTGPGPRTDTMTVTRHVGDVTARATSYGNTITYMPTERPQMAVDGDPATAWRTAAFTDPRGERLELSFTEPVTTDRVRFLQPDDDATRHITNARLGFHGDDDGDSDDDTLDIVLTEVSLQAPGESITFPERTFTRLSIEILADSTEAPAVYSTQGAVGFSEVQVGDIPNQNGPALEVIRLPTDLLDAAGDNAIDHPLAISLTRQRLGDLEPDRADAETALARLFQLPGSRTVSLEGTARLAPQAPSTVLGELTGRPHDGSVPYTTTTDTVAEHFDSGCRNDLLTVNGEPVPLRVTGTMAAALAGDPLEVRDCGDDSATLPAGETLVLASPGQDTGIHLDQVVLRSAAGGGAFVPGNTPQTLVQAATDHDDPLARTPTVEVATDGATAWRLRVKDAEPGEPFWLAFGQSHNPGWVARVAGGPALPSELVNGYANGWLVTPDAESFDIVLEFTPQRTVDRALLLSVVAGLGCVGLALRRPRPGAPVPSAAPAPFDLAATLRFDGNRPATMSRAAVALGLAGLGYVLAGPLVAVVTGALAGLAGARRNLRWCLPAASLAAFTLAVASVLYTQLRWGPAAGLDWPHEMRRGHLLGWLAVLLLAADVAVGHLWRRTRPPGGAGGRRPRLGRATADLSQAAGLSRHVGRNRMDAPIRPTDTR